jgi:cytochrome c oxidase assembly protein subunit 15
VPGMKPRSSTPWNWPHLVACLLVAVTAVLLGFGALVTTYEAAMAVPDWPATYGHNMFLFPLTEWLHGPWDLFLEHGHRLLGALAGMITLVLAGLVWWRGGSPAVRALAVAAVLLVIGQGVLGGARVLLDDKTVAKVHACTGPLFFAVAVAVATLTRRNAVQSDGWPSVRWPAGWSAAALAVAAYLQLVAGAQLRHLDRAIDPGTFHGLVALHVAGAVAVLALVLGVVSATAGRRHESPASWWWARGLLLVIGGQWMLGLATWAVKWGVPTGMLPEAWQFTGPLVARSASGAAIVTGHVLLGMLILGGSVVLAIVSGGLGSVRLGSGELERIGVWRRGRVADKTVAGKERGFA